MIHHRYALHRRLDAVIERVDYIRVPVTDMERPTTSTASC